MTRTPNSPCVNRRYGCVGRLKVEEANGRRILVCSKCGAAHGLAPETAA